MEYENLIFTNEEKSMFNDTETNCYEIYQLRKLFKYLTEDIYTCTYDTQDLCETIPLVMGLADMVSQLQNM